MQRLGLRLKVHPNLKELIVLITASFVYTLAASVGGSLALAKLMKVVTFIIVFCMLVFFHEFGHFITAKRNDVLVHEFSIGMGPLIYSFVKGETTYALRAIPIGGYVKLEGEDLKSDHPRSLAKKKPWQKLMVLAAGAIMNFLLAILLFFIIFTAVGLPTTTLSQVFPGKPAAVAGLQAGDKIVAVDGKAVSSWESVTTAIGSMKGSIPVTYSRQGQEKTVVITPVRDESSKRMIIGIVPVNEKHLGRTLSYSVERVGYITKSILQFLADIPFKGVKSQDVSGPVGIFNMVGQAAQSGVLDVLFLTAVLSINLGIFNLLPFPALDGGRIVFVLVEWVRGKPIDQEKEGFVHFIGFALLLALMIFMVFNDLRHMTP